MKQTGATALFTVYLTIIVLNSPSTTSFVLHTTSRAASGGSGNGGITRQTKQNIFHVPPPSYSSTLQKSSSLSSSQDENDETNIPDTTLIIGDEFSNALKTIATEAGYLNAARKRNLEAKAKLMEQLQQEEMEAERIRKEREEKGNPDNYGPTDMTSFVDFKDDGFESSEGNDETGGWSELKTKGKLEEDGEKKEEPKLFLFGDDDDDNKILTSGSGLIL